MHIRYFLHVLHILQTFGVKGKKIRFKFGYRYLLFQKLASF
jgi:hypothetical protein